MNTHFPPPQPEQRRTGDPLIDERLARLEARRSTGQPPSGHHPQAGSTRPTDQRTRRAHPARGSRAAALALSATTTVGLAAWLQQADATDTAGTVSSGTVSSGASTASAAAATTAAAEGTTVTTAVAENTTVTTAVGENTTAASVVQVAEQTSSSSTDLADGTYTGDVDSNRWGDVQVQITVADGVITDVKSMLDPADFAASNVAVWRL